MESKSLSRFIFPLSNENLFIHFPYIVPKCRKIRDKIE